MMQQAGGVSEPLGAGGAAVGSLAGVRAQVVGQVEAVLEALARHKIYKKTGRRDQLLLC